MSAEVLNSFTALQNELSQAKNSLKDYDEHIKRLIGRDPSESGLRNNKRQLTSQQNEEFRGRFSDNHNTPGRFSRQLSEDNSFSRQRNQFTNRTQNLKADEPPLKKRSIDSSVFKRLDKPRPNDDDYPNKPQMHSRVIVTPREIPSRQEALKAQDRDEKSKARNRRMFGALLGTLQKFRQEETKLKTKEEKRAQVEKKLEEQEVLEKAKIKKEKYELFLGRKKKQQEIRIIEQKMLRIKEQTVWEEQHKHLVNFIRTTSKPHIFYLPRKMTPKNKEKLDETKNYIEKLIEDKRQQLQQELEAIENRFKKEDEQNSKDLEDGEIDEHDEIHDMLNAELNVADHPEENDSSPLTPEEPPSQPQTAPTDEQSLPNLDENSNNGCIVKIEKENLKVTNEEHEKSEDIEEVKKEGQQIGESVKEFVTEPMETDETNPITKSNV